MNCEIPYVPAAFRKGRGTTDQIAITCWIFEKAREFQKYTYFCFIDHAKAFDCVDHNKRENLQRWEYQTILSAFSLGCKEIHPVMQKEINPEYSLEELMLKLNL